MSTKSTYAVLERCLAVFEPIEPRLLLSAGYGTVLPIYCEPGGGELSTPYVDFEPVQRDEHPTIRGSVLELVAAIGEMMDADPQADPSTFSLKPLRQVSPQGEIKIEIRFDSERTDMLAVLTSLGFEAGSFHQTGSSASQGTTTGWAPYTAIESIGEVPGLLEVSLSMAAVTRTGSVTSAGDGILNADDLRGLVDVDGTGVKVGVISDGADHWDDVNDFGDLPESITVDDTRPGTGDEGTAMMEIIHDLAPGAELYFSGPINANQMVASIEWLVNQGCDVIVDDLGIYTQPVFEDGAVAEAALDAIDEGVVYISAAGNDAETHYQANFDDYGDGSHEFAQAQNLLRFYLGGYSSTTGVLQWSDECGASGNNYDLHLYQWTGSNWSYVGGSTGVQDGDDDPLESIGVYNPNAEAVQLAWLVHQYSGSDRELELFTLGNVALIDTQLVVPGDSIFGHAAAEGVIAVGAIDASDAGNDDIEDFSSHGPSTIYTNFSTQTSTERDSLDVAGIDGVSTKAGDEEYFASEPFYGTSAAAPHIAGIAALLLEIDADLTPAEIEDLIDGNAVDLGDAAYDEVFGYGRADALATVSAATDAPDLADSYDTGVSDEDDITKLDNSDGGKTLQFDVLGTIAGATVTLYADETEIGSAVATGTTTTVTTNGSDDLADGERTITARQTEPGKLGSVASDALAVTVDTAAPTVVEFNRGYQSLDDWRLRPTELHTISLEFSEDVSDTLALGDLSLYNLSTSEAESLNDVDFSYDAEVGTWDFDGRTPTEGWYRVTISAAGVTDVAGNALDGDADGTGGDDYVYGAADPDNDMLVPLGGDADLDGDVDRDDLMTVVANFGQSGMTWEQGDFDYDGLVNFLDYLTVKSNLGKSLSR